MNQVLRALDEENDRLYKDSKKNESRYDRDSSVIFSFVNTLNTETSYDRCHVTVLVDCKAKHHGGVNLYYASKNHLFQ